MVLNKYMTKSPQTEREYCPICHKDIAKPGELHIAGSICVGHTVKEIEYWHEQKLSQALDRQREEIIDKIDKMIDIGYLPIPNEIGRTRYKNEALREYAEHLKSKLNSLKDENNGLKEKK